MEESIQNDLPKLIGCTLTDIRVRTFCTEFQFLSAVCVTVRIKTEFKFSINGDRELRFDPTLTVHDATSESTRFVLLHGMKCRSVMLSKQRFEVDFEGDARLWVELGENDFEPLELIGASGERYEKLDFYYVL